MDTVAATEVNPTYVGGRVWGQKIIWSLITKTLPFIIVSNERAPDMLHHHTE